VPNFKQNEIKSRRHCLLPISCRFKFSSAYILTSGPGWRSQYCDSIQAGWSGNRILVGAGFSAPVQSGPGAHPASFTMGTGSLSWGKVARAWLTPPSPFCTKVKEKVELYLYSRSGPSWPVLGWWWWWSTLGSSPYGPNAPGLIDRPFVPLNLISTQESPVPLPKFQMAPRLKILMVSGSKKGTHIYFSCLQKPSKRTPSRFPNRPPMKREACPQGILHISKT
jgi:hypothetical protein